MIEHVMGDLELISVKTITFKYFEKGHTFMGVDSVHAKKEKVLKKIGKLYDYSDMLGLQCDATGNCRLLRLEIGSQQLQT